MSNNMAATQFQSTLDKESNAIQKVDTCYTK